MLVRIEATVKHPVSNPFRHPCSLHLPSARVFRLGLPTFPLVRQTFATIIGILTPPPASCHRCGKQLNVDTFSTVLNLFALQGTLDCMTLLSGPLDWKPNEAAKRIPKPAALSPVKISVCLCEPSWLSAQRSAFSVIEVKAVFTALLMSA